MRKLIRWVQRPRVAFAMLVISIAVYVLAWAVRLLGRDLDRHPLYFEQLKLPELQKKDSMLHKN